jgi:hypothetical protein
MDIYIYLCMNIRIYIYRYDDNENKDEQMEQIHHNDDYLNIDDDDTPGNDMDDKSRATKESNPSLELSKSGEVYNNFSITYLYIYIYT